MDSRKPLATLAQRYGLWQSQELELYDDEIRICARSGPNLSRRRVPLDLFDTNESEGRAFPTGLCRAWRVAALVSLVLLSIAAAAWLQVGRAPLWTLWASAGTGAATTLLWIASIAFAYDAIYFYHAYTGDFLCALVIGRPDRAAAEAFFRQLKALAKQRAERTKEEAAGLSVARELRALYDLREKKLISPEEFETKKGELIDEVMRE